MSSPTPKHRRKRGSMRPDSSPLGHPLTKMEPPNNLFPSKGEFLRLVAVLAIAAMVAYTCNLVANYFNSNTRKPFCDSDLLLDSLDSPPDFCEPCPRNGECYRGELECARGYRKHGNICVEDGDIDERAKKLSQWVKNHLCGAYAQFLCYGIGTVWVQEHDLLNNIDERQLIEGFGSDEASYFYMKNRTMENIGRALETRTNPHGIEEFKCPDLLVESYKPISCRINQWILNHVLVIVPACMLVMVSMLLILKAQKRWHLASRAEQLYHQICDILEENALASREGNSDYESWVVASRLRDHLLLPRERKEPLLWKKVEELVQQDSRVDIYPKLVKGESKVVWEWQVEGSLSSERMKRRGEAKKLRPIEGGGAISPQPHHALKTDVKGFQHTQGHTT